MRRLTSFLATMLVACLVAAPTMAKSKSKDSDEVKKLNEANLVLQAAVSAPDKGIPRELLEKAECVGVFPDVKKAAFVVGGEGGKGVFTCRGENGMMSAPAFFSMGGPSIGWQAGIREADLVLLIMNREGVNKLLQDHFKLGGEASAAAGPVGRTAQAATDAQLHAQILSWSRSRGLFAGVSLEGMVITQSHGDTKDFYGREIDAKNILVNHQVEVPA